MLLFVASIYPIFRLAALIIDFFVFNQLWDLLTVCLLFRLCFPFAFFRLLPRKFHWLCSHWLKQNCDPFYGHKQQTVISNLVFNCYCLNAFDAVVRCVERGVVDCRFFLMQTRVISLQVLADLNGQSDQSTGKCVELTAKKIERKRKK